ATRGQRLWIGRSRGVDVDFPVAGSDVVLTAFTTRIDTLFGATFVAIAPDHPVLPSLGIAPAEGSRFTGLHAVSPADGSMLPIWVAEHVVAGYGTGIVMGVPAHDERDAAFAQEVGLPTVRVVVPDGDGAEVLTGSGPFTGMRADDARAAIASWLEAEGRGRPAVRYRLHDWLISRQRYWGPPIPIVHCPACGAVPVPEDQLPVLLPDIASPEDVRPT